MKKAIALIISLVLIFALVACNKDDPAPAPSQSAATGDTAQEAPPASGGASTNVNDYWRPADGPPASYDANHEVYTMSNRLPWTGIFAPPQASRSHIEKALSTFAAKDSGNITIGYATWTVGSPYFAYLENTVRTTAEALGWTVITAVSDADVGKQIANIENFITMGVDLIIDQAHTPEAEAAVIQQAVDAGIPVIGLGMPYPDDTPVVTNAAALFYEMGFELGILVAEHFRGESVKLALNPGMPSHAISDGKTNGFIGGFVYARAIQNGEPLSREEAMLYGYNLHQESIRSAKFSDPKYNWECVASIDGFWNKEGGQKATEDILTANPDINLLFAGNDEQAMGAALAVQQAGLVPGDDIIIVGVGDCSKVALDYIENGEIFAIMLFSPITSAKSTVDLANMIINEGFDASNLPSDLSLGIDTATKANAGQWRATGDENYPAQADQPIVPLS